MTKQQTKEIVKKIKKKWFIYFLIAILVALVWGLYYGRHIETSPNKVLYVWVTPAKVDQEQENALEQSEKDINNIMQAFEDNYKEFGFSKYKTQMQSLSNNDELLNYNLFNQHDGDISILPISYFTQSEQDTYTQLQDLSEYNLTGADFISGKNYYGEQIEVALKLNEHYALAVSINATAPEGVIENLLKLVLDVI